VSGEGGDHRLRRVDLDPGTLASPSSEIEHERQVAVFDLVEQSSFRPEGAARGPYDLAIGCEENRLVLDVSGPDFAKRHMLSLTPLKGVIRDYHAICDSYHEAVRGSTPSQIEAIDMGRRGLHNEGATLLRERLAGKIELDHETARRLFTLISALHRRA